MPKIIENLPEMILQAANEVLLERGSFDFSIRALAARLGIAPATIYNYYPSKERILEALVDDAWHKLMEAIDLELYKAESSLQALNRIYELLHTAMNPMYSHWLTPDVKSMPEGHPAGQEIFAKKQRISGDLTQRIEKALLLGGNDTANAEVFTRLFIMCSHHRQLAFEDIVRAICDLK